MKFTKQTPSSDGPTRPTLRWNHERDAALVLAVRSADDDTANTVTAQSVCDALKMHDAFSGCEDAVTSAKVIARRNVLHKKGIDLPKFQHSTYQPDVSTLNTI